MDCLGTADIRRYVQGTMSDQEADAVTKHLVACKRCRQMVAEMRGTTDPRRGLHEMPTVEKKPGMIKVQCDKCAARYGIPEERVRGRRLKIRCKNCASIIEVVGGETAESPGVIKSVIDRGRKLWFLVIKRQRVGPMTEQEVRERFERGEVKAKTYAWRQGFSKWERLSSIPEFKDLAEAAQRTPSITRKGRVPTEDDPDRTEKARPPRAYVGPIEPGSSEELDFDRASSLARTAYLPEEGGADSAVRTAYVPGGTPAADGQVTHVHLAQRDPLAGMEVSDAETSEARFDAQSEEAWAAELQDYQEPPQVDPRLQSGEWDQHMKGQRHDNSVLFSLGHLRKLAGAPTERGRVPSQSGSTGLFDIRPMAGPPASALLLPEEPGRRRSGVGLVLGVALLGVVVGAGVLLGILYLVQPSLVTALLRGDQVEPEGTESPGTRVALGPAADHGVPARSVPTTEAIPVDVGVPDAVRPPDAGVPVVEEPAKPKADRPAKRAPARTRRKPKRRRPASDGIEVVDPDKGKKTRAPTPAPEPVIPPAPEAKPRPKDRKSELDELIDGATGPDVRSKPAPRPQKRPEEDGAEDDAPKAPAAPRTLTREQVAAGMKRAEPFVRLCYKQYGEPGVVTLSATIDGAAGRISHARVVGAFAGTPTGTCVVDAVRRVALFPRFSGPPLTLKYPYMLR